MIPAIIRNKLFLFIFFLIVYSQALQAQFIPRQYQQNKSFTYQETIQYYQQLDKKYKHAYLVEKGTTDIGKPLHLFIMYGGKNFQKEVIEKKQVPILLIMNGIHPGEPDGIDASLLLAEWILLNHDSLLKNTCICIIPVYNIDGALQRGCCSRANQNGPELYGFRGNAKNLDLNRDFIKMDTKNSQSFVQLFQWLQPDLFIDTHVSNGADYQYTFTLLTTQKNKLERRISQYLYNDILPQAETYMNSAGWPVSPYVNSIEEVPDSGLVAFYDSPRYSTGYAALFNVPGFVVETHMLKPFSKRVEATLEFLKFASIFIHNQGAELKSIKNQSIYFTGTASHFGLNWKPDFSKKSNLGFLGYAAGYKKSLVTHQNRLYYDTLQPYLKNIPMYWDFYCVDSVAKPTFYIIPQAWQNIIDKLSANQVPMEKLTADEEIWVQTSKIISYQSSPTPYEGHHIKRNLVLEKIELKRWFYKGDIRIKTGTRFDYFLATVLEPQGIDSYFTWGFFDAILQQKEWFSDYVWEDKANELLQSDPQLLYNFEKKKINDTAFAHNEWEQLYYIYKNSPYFEPTYMQYPVYKAYSN